MRKSRISLAILVLTAAILSVRWARADASDSDGLHGTFIATVTTEARTFKAMYTFTPDGGVVETNLNPVGNTVVSHGAWVRTGERQFVFVLWFLGQVPGDPNSSFVRGKARETITLNGAGNGYSAAIQLSFFGPGGNLIGSAQATAQASRITAGQSDDE